jgi:hypothetical protein
MAFARRRSCPVQRLKRRRQLDEHAATILTWMRPDIAHMDRGQIYALGASLGGSQRQGPRRSCRGLIGSLDDSLPCFVARVGPS